MGSSNVLLDSIQIEIGGENEWPDDAKLFQPYETEQILMPDSANCLAVQAFLQMANLKYETVYKANAADMSPTGRVPFIKVGQYLVAELEPIVAFVQNKNITLTSSLTDAEKSDMRAYMSLINTVFGNAENYVTWCDAETYNKVTKKRFGSIHPFPLNHILLWQKRSATIERMKALGGKTEQDAVLDDVDLCCQSLSDRLGDRDFFFKSGPTELDCLLYGHVSTILNWPHLNVGNLLAQIICKYPKLVCHGIAMKNRVCTQKSDVFSVYGPLITIYNNICSSTKKKKIKAKDGGTSYDCKDVVTNGGSRPVILYANSSDSSKSDLCSSSSIESTSSDSDCQTETHEKCDCNHARSLNKDFRSDVIAFSQLDNARSFSNKEFCSAATSSCQSKQSQNKGRINAKSCLNKKFCSDIVTASHYNKKCRIKGGNDTKPCSNKKGTNTSASCSDKKLKDCKKSRDTKSKQTMHVRINENTVDNSASFELRKVCADDQIASNLAFENSATPACSTSHRQSSRKYAGSKSSTPTRFESLSFMNCPQLFNICGSVMDAMRIGCLTAGTKESTTCKNDKRLADDTTADSKCLQPAQVDNKAESCDDKLSLSGSSSSSIVCTRTEKFDVKLFTNETNRNPCIKIGRSANRPNKSVDDDLKKSRDKKKIEKLQKKVEISPCRNERRTRIDVNYYDSNKTENFKSGCKRVKNSEEENNTHDKKSAQKALRSESKSQCRCPLRKCIYGVTENKTRKTDLNVPDLCKSEKTNFQVCSSSSSEDSQCDKLKCEKDIKIPLNSSEPPTKKTCEKEKNSDQDKCDRSKSNPKVGMILEQETCVYVDRIVPSNLNCSEQKLCQTKNIENSCPLSNPESLKEKCIAESLENSLCTQIIANDKTTDKSVCREKIMSTQGGRKNSKSISESSEDSRHSQTVDKLNCLAENICAQETKKKEQSVSQKCASTQEADLVRIKKESDRTRDGEPQVFQIACDASAENDKSKKTTAKMTHIPVPMKSKVKENVKVSSKIDPKNGNLYVSFLKTQNMSTKTPTVDIKLESSSFSKLDIKHKKSSDECQTSSKEQAPPVRRKSVVRTCSAVGFNEKISKEAINCITPAERKPSEEENLCSKPPSKKNSKTDACLIQTDTNLSSHKEHDLKKCAKTETTVCEAKQTVQDQHPMSGACDVSSIFVNKRVKNSPVEEGSVHCDLSLDSVSSDVLKGPTDESGSECDLSIQILKAAECRPPTMSMNNVLSKLSEEGKSEAGASQPCSRIKSPPNESHKLKNRSVSENLKPLDSESTCTCSSDESSEAKPSNGPVSKISVRQNLGECPNFAFTENLDSKNPQETNGDASDKLQKSVSENVKPDDSRSSSMCHSADGSLESEEVKLSNCPVSKISVRQNVGECVNFAFTENLDTQSLDKKPEIKNPLKSKPKEDEPENKK